jgi:probable F420-dependent oxidoreductase
VRYGAVLPQTQIERDPGNVVAFAKTAEAAGFSFLSIYDHVLGADVTTRPEWNGPYALDDQFHEPFVLFGYLAAITQLELVTGVLVLPQRQTALVAKQAAEVDILTEGRFRLGVGIGWNEVEYDALGVDFHTRGARVEEQIELLRRLWTEESVTFDGRFDQLDRVGILPRPIQSPIPIWMGGGTAPRVLERIGRIADGWICNTRPHEEAARALATVHEAARIAGRETMPGLQINLRVPDFDRGALERQLEEADRLGATHLSVNGLKPPRTPAQHLEVIHFAAEVIGERMNSQA